jgi:hypothetical protein
MHESSGMTTAMKRPELPLRRLLDERLGETRGACPLPYITKIFFHKNITDVFTPATAKCFHYQRRPPLDMSI